MFYAVCLKLRRWNPVSAAVREAWINTADYNWSVANAACTILRDLYSDEDGT